MEQINFNNYKLVSKKSNERGDLLVELSKKLNRPIGQIGALTKGWNLQGIRGLLHSSEAMARDMGIEFEKSFWWHFNKIKKDLRPVDKFF